MDEFLVKKYESLITKVLLQEKIILTKFLTPQEQLLLTNINNGRISLHFDDIIKNSERKRCLLVPLYYNGKINFDIELYQINYNRKYLEISHRNILGTILSLGIKREVVGDIVIKDFCAYFACCKEIGKYIEENFKVINHNPISISKTSCEVEVSEVVNLKDLVVASLRCDVLISGVYNLSRNVCDELFEQKIVNQNNKIVNKSFQIINQCDIISVRGYGRFKILSIKPSLKKNKFHVQVNIYR